ncbi:MAG: hypothetical protein A3I14_12800 [Candidatus Rokubacteria bacterium RIFCSPLOWO2_02_FULL_73_56]|nr:MAG: hypothetical protein A3I14_12800 [Candidatus Rokubacteria bacterium RIFCSPLOWO2_02_FULL_73_56]
MIGDVRGPRDLATRRLDLRKALPRCVLLLALAPLGCTTVATPSPPPIASPPAQPSPPAPPVSALARLREAVSRDPGDAQARASLGQALIGRGEMAEASVWLREALRLAPDLGEARASLGLALYAMGDVGAAVEELRAVRRARPDLAAARLTLAAALVARQDWPAARAELEELVAAHPDLAQAHYTLGAVRYTEGDLEGAIAAYRRVLALEPRHADARYNLALVLKLARRDAEATPEFLAAARAGLPNAQFFAGTAYAGGLGVERDLAGAVRWWSRAAAQGLSQAEEALAELRLVALGRTRRGPAEREAAEQAFRDFRERVWSEYADLSRDGADTVGAALLRAGRVPEAVRALLREAAALSEPAVRQLETLYEHGVEGRLAAHDPRILGYFESATSEGQVRPRIALARFYARGLGVPKDVARALGLLRATPHEDAQRLLRELSAASP